MNKRNRKRKSQYERRVNRKYKDSLFRKIFSDRKDLLNLYNALNDTQYTDEEGLTVTTLEDVIYISMKNDVSFLLGGTMNLYEHQSSYNPNMPIRGLMYLARLYQNYIDDCEINVFSPVLKHLPRPKFIVFYNGSKDEPDQKILRLTDAFAEEGIPGESCLECCATMLNINYGHNYELMEKCRRLEEYSVFVAEVRKALEEGDNQRQAVDDAIDICIEKGVLRDILIRERAAIMNMVLSCTEKQYERLVEKELEQQDKKIKEQEKKLKAGEKQLRAGERKMEEQKKQLRAREKKMEEQERLLKLNRILVQEKEYELLERIQDDPELQKELIEQYGI
ncbi:MAG TPA: hypothetical protein H9758_07790 [Candidatus Mediterraneibacter faecipullorum]|uniref:Transposase (putative) YhgA-like domain-containing protein n=1 Tax=Candidatus Mediterraneibacter faecipullorum TaxID=2838670 RepID=A0A9D2NP74_9FIRM|nr:hypothetical protein [Candidatus Mediterraneibacter faecipullorum]